MRHRLVPILLGCAATAGACAQTLTLHYQDRPPYSSAASGGAVAGLVASPADAALRRAGIAYAWALTPSQRQLALIQQGNGLHCGLGWFRNAERAAQGKFSAPLYRDEPFAAVARAGVLAEGPLAARDALAAASGGLLLKDGYSYGSYLDGLIAAALVAPSRTSVEPLQMLRMLAAGRAGWMIATPEEATVMLSALGPEAAGLRLLRFSDVPPGQTRHLYCNRAVPDDWLARIDRALDAPAR